MKKTHIAFVMSTERLAEMGGLYLWTFTYKEKLDILVTRKRWNHFLTLIKRRWPEVCGLRVFEMHKSHGLHVHLLTNRFLDVNEARKMAAKAGWGRIHAKKIPADLAAYPGKYLSKDRPECFKGWRLWAAFGDWRPTRVSDLEKRSAFSVVYRHFKERYDWEGNQGFFKRMEQVKRALEFETRTAVVQRKNGSKSELADKLLASERVILL